MLDGRSNVDGGPVERTINEAMGRLASAWECNVVADEDDSGSQVGYNDDHGFTEGDMSPSDEEMSEDDFGARLERELLEIGMLHAA